MIIISLRVICTNVQWIQLKKEVTNFNNFPKIKTGKCLDIVLIYILLNLSVCTALHVVCMHKFTFSHLQPSDPNSNIRQVFIMPCNREHLQFLGGKPGENRIGQDIYFHLVGVITSIVQYIDNKVTVIQIALLLSSWMPYKSGTCQRIKKIQ